MNVSYIIGAILVVFCLVGVFIAVFMKTAPYRHPGQPNADADPGPKPAAKKNPTVKPICSSDWEEGSNGGSYF